MNDDRILDRDPFARQHRQVWLERNRRGRPLRVGCTTGGLVKWAGVCADACSRPCAVWPTVLIYPAAVRQAMGFAYAQITLCRNRYHKAACLHAGGVKISSQGDGGKLYSYKPLHDDRNGFNIFSELKRMFDTAKSRKPLSLNGFRLCTWRSRRDSNPRPSA